jgi:SAM-dependent methyltransferase
MEGSGRTDGPYWDSVVELWRPTLTHRLWRAHSDAVNGLLLRRWLDPGGGAVLKTDLFDEAVGEGLRPELAGRFERMVGVDVSPAAAAAAARRYPDLDVRVASVLALPFRDGSFDAIVSNSTLDHFRSHATIVDAVRELARLLRAGGKLVITLDNRTNPVVALRTSLLFEALHRVRAVPYFVGATHGAWGLRKLLNKAGFEVREITSIMHCPPQLAAWLTSHRAAGSPVDTADHLRHVLRFEAMERWPTSHLTGHFVAALAVRKPRL